jgi:YHS domain-containing protein
MNKVILTLATAALMVTAFAQKAPKEIACAVMGSHKVNIKAATKAKMFADYNGKRYFFCCGGCPAEFKKDPTKFKDAPSIPTPKAKVKK